MSEPGLLVVMTGPSGVGKTSLVRRVQASLPELRFSVSCTTRPQREGERDGVDYRFIDSEDFARRLEAKEFLEHATVHGNSYGTLRSHVAEAVARGEVILLDIDVQGAAQLRASGVDAVFLFVLPPSMEALEERLRSRATDSEDVIERRLAVARSEIGQSPLFDHELVNDDLERAAEAFVGILQRERSRRRGRAQMAP